MKYFTYLAMSVMIISVTLLFFIKKPNGQPWLSTSVIYSESIEIKDEMVALSSGALDSITLAITTASEKITGATFELENPKPIYKWQDGQGQWHFSDVPNKNGKSEVVKLNPADINVVVAEDTAILSGSAKSAALPFPQRAPEIYNSESINKLFEDAEKAKKRIEQRSKEVESFSGF
ncbi:hypothetical protein P20311_0068 [Pseudoalteromonas sp. BSi20311]|uniref:DUF4124 domain-containing protein n=1 Tax=Pseudoalteromonas sp. BSi20311 TaxID=383911 RepID=UPI0002317681|nr:DUF4124 domain-containing protein [Pseudoalteromonas sp. BSi20311]GAA62300.1 hypothetical protein P20311_0068 [Pseudoalteromonas sp. BSi20311]HCP96804.1 DUF4124 domain-containing protein [Pseudoalteromonas sp.]